MAQEVDGAIIEPRDDRISPTRETRTPTGFPTRKARSSRLTPFRSTNARRDDVADHGGLAVGGIEATGAARQPGEFGAQPCELTDPIVELGCPAVDQVADVVARGLTPFSKGEHAADLTKGEPAGLRGADESEPTEDRLVVTAVPVGGAGRRRQQAEVLVVADGLGRHSGAVGDLTDAHTGMLRLLDLPPYGKVQDEAVDITLMCVEDCPHVALARHRIADALSRLGLDVVPTERIVGDEAEATSAGFRGSPTILIDGTDPFPTVGPTGLSCRLYATEAGREGAPSVEQLVEALSR